MLKVIDNFCEENTLKELFRFAADSAHKNIWSNSLKWDMNIIKDSNTVHILTLDNQLPFIKELIKKYKSLGIGLDSPFYFNLYVWPKLSYIPFHDDGQNEVASTIYLNKSWERDFGGLFLYEDKDEIKAIVPKFNKCIINTNNLKHGTSMTTFDAPVRLSLQMFIPK